MAYSKVLEELRIKLAPYIRNAIIGDQNRIGRGALYERKVDDNTYVLGGKEITLENQNDKDFFEVVAFVEKFLKSEIGGANKSNENLDRLIGEILHTLKFNSTSVEGNLKNVIENEIMTDPSFESAADAFFRLEEKVNLAGTLQTSDIDGMSNIASYGEYGQLRNQIYADEYKLRSDASLSQEQKNELSEKIKQNYQKAIAMQNLFKQESKQILDKDPALVEEVKRKCSELMQIARANEKGSEAYENAVLQMRQIAEEYKDIIGADKKYKKAIEEIRKLRKSESAFEQGFENASQMQN